MRRGNRTGLLVLVPLNIAAWLIGSIAVYQFNLYLFSVTFIINACLAAAVFSFHTLGNPKVRANAGGRGIRTFSDPTVAVEALAEDHGQGGTKQRQQFTCAPKSYLQRIAWALQEHSSSTAYCLLNYGCPSVILTSALLDKLQVLRSAQEQSFSFLHVTHHAQKVLQIRNLKRRNTRTFVMDRQRHWLDEIGCCSAS